MNVWVCLDISYQTNSTDKIFENKKHVPFLFQKFTPFNFGVIFVVPPGNFPATLDVDFSIRVVTSENVSEGFPKAA